MTSPQPLRPDDAATQIAHAADLLRTLDLASADDWVLDLSSAPKRVVDDHGIVASGDSLEEVTDQYNTAFAAFVPHDLRLLLADEAARAAGKTGVPELQGSPRLRREIMLRWRDASPAPWRFNRSATAVTIHSDGHAILVLVPDAIGELQAELLCTAIDVIPVLLVRSNAAAMAERRRERGESA